MKHGYSLFLGEYIRASHIEYDDCKAFQITCPACYEPVFKVTRHGEVNSINYLSHYPESKSEPEKCELRVRGISSSVKDASNIKSRNQKLEYFLSVFQEMISQDAMYPNGCEKAQKQLNHSKSIRTLREVSYDFQQKKKHSKPEFYSFAEGYVTDIAEMNGIINTAFTLTIQKRIAFDVWNFLLSAKGSSNYNFLFNHAYLVVLSRLSLASDKRVITKEQKYLGDCLAKLVSTSKKRGLIILSEMAHTAAGPPFAIEGSNFYNKALSEILHEMVGALLTLPYFEWLKKVKGER